MLKQPDTADLPNNHRCAFNALSTMGVFVLSILAISGCTQSKCSAGETNRCGGDSRREYRFKHHCAPNRRRWKTSAIYNYFRQAVE